MGIEFDTNNIKIVPIDEVRPNSWNPKDKETNEFASIKRGIEKKGLRLPIYVREKDGYEIIDGEQRWRACKDLGFKTILIYNSGETSDQDAQEMTTWLQFQVPFNEVDLAHLVKKLVSDYKEVVLPYTDAQIENYIKMAEFDFEQFDEDETALTDEDIEMAIYRVTLAQKNIIDSAINKIREESNKIDMSDGRALELMAGDFLAGVKK